jgi:hypothetical protein
MREEMRSLGGDTEIAHSRADDILIEAIRYLASLLPPKDKTLWAREAEDLITSWRDLEKWYA